MYEGRFKGKYRIASSRASWWDYRQAAAYFVTMVTKNRVCYFGDIKDGVMDLSRVGVIADILWDEIKNHTNNVQLDAFTVMPNHLHGILILQATAVAVETGHALSHINDAKPNGSDVSEDVTTEDKRSSQFDTGHDMHQTNQPEPDRRQNSDAPDDDGTTPRIETGHALSQMFHPEIDDALSQMCGQAQPSPSEAGYALSPVIQSEIGHALSQNGQPQSPQSETRHALSLQSPRDGTANNCSDSEARERSGDAPHPRFQNPGKNSLSSILGSYKSAVSRHSRRLGFEFGWQPRFHDHIIRDHDEYLRIARYIRENPLNWNEDEHNC